MTTQTMPAPVIAAPGAGRVIDSFHRVRVLIERDDISVLEVSTRPGEEPPMHIHDREDETFYVLEGRLTLFVGDARHDAPAGACALLPRGVPHTFAVESESVRMLVVCTPGGFEGMFDAVPAPVDMAVAQAAFARFGITVTGPNPGA